MLLKGFLERDLKLVVLDVIVGVNIIIKLILLSFSTMHKTPSFFTSEKIQQNA